LEKIYDISVRLGDESINYPGDTPYSRELTGTIKGNGIYELSKLVMSAHSGTHIDTPAHFIQGGKTLDQYEAGDFILPARVIEIRDKLSVRPAELESLTIGAGEALLFRTNNSMSGQSRNGTFSEQFVYLSPEAADICIEKKVKLVGLDYITVERYGDQEFPTHRRLLENDIPILEGIHLKNVPAGNYTLICLPLRIGGGEASPVRAILVQ
jgi:arylformamidase